MTEDHADRWALQDREETQLSADEFKDKAEAERTMHGSCQQHGCQWPQGLAQTIAERDRYREAIAQAREHLGWGRAVEADNVLHEAQRHA